MMQASIVIPVWNGASVLGDCLDAVYAHSGDELLEVICVDNASHDDSAALIADHYPRARLIRQPVNLGFAGGVNAGVDVAQGEVSILLNQDCVVQTGWLKALMQAFEAHPEFGIAGCTILNPDGTLNHVGAMIRRPDAYGVHLAEIGDGQPQRVEYVTGAAFALRRQTWDIVGRFDEGYYPAYYEESDYCYRARRKGIETAFVPAAHVIHLFTSREWQTDPVKHTANQHRSRYRFVSKHFDSREIREFFEAEYAAVENECYFDQAIGRLIAARDTLRSLPGILERRKNDLGDALPPMHRCQLQVEFTQVLRRSFSLAEKLGPYQSVESLSDLANSWQATTRQLETIPGLTPGEPSVFEAWQNVSQRLQALRQREYDLLTRIYFREPSADHPEPTWRRLFRLLVLRPLSFLIGRDYLLLAELNTVHVTRMDLMERQIGPVYRLFKEQRDQLDRRLTLLEILTDYDYR